MAALAASIREVGVLQPVLVRVGQRRASTSSSPASAGGGPPGGPACRRPRSGPGRPATSSLEQALVENLHREDLSPLEEAAAYQQLIDDFGLTHEQVAGRRGKSGRRSPTPCAFCSCRPGVQRVGLTRAISAGHARALLGTPDRAFQEARGPESWPRGSRYGPSRTRFRLSRRRRLEANSGRYLWYYRVPTGQRPAPRLPRTRAARARGAPGLLS